MTQEFISLARKWRPRRLSDMVGHEFTVRALQNAVSQNRLHHAFLFTGTRGVGKTTLARIVAMLVNCESPVDNEPCQRCESCAAIVADRFPDVIELDAATHTGVDNMRELLEGAALYAPIAGKVKVIIFDEVHMLSASAFNAMLKILEEPPPHLKFIFATTNPQKIPPTIISRCLSFDLAPMSRDMIGGRLAHILTAEKHDYDEAAVTEIARLARGSLRDGLSILEQAIAHKGEKLLAEDVRRMAGFPDTAILGDILRAVGKKDAAKISDMSAALAAGHFAFDITLMRLAAIIFRAALLQAAPAAPCDDPDDEAAARRIIGLFDAEQMQVLYEIAIRGRRQLPYAPDERSGFEMTLLRMMLFAPQEVDSPDSLTPRRLPEGAKPLAVAGESLATSTPQNSRGEFYPPGCAAEGESSAAGGEIAPAGGENLAAGVERIAAGGKSSAVGGGDSERDESLVRSESSTLATPQNSRGEFYPPPQAAEGESSAAGFESVAESESVTESKSAVESKSAMESKSAAESESVTESKPAVESESASESKSTAESKSAKISVVVSWAGTLSALGAAARGLAENCVVKHFDGGGVTLVLDKSKKNAGRLRTMLEEELRRIHGDSFRVVLQNGDDDEAADERSKSLLAAARATPFVADILGAMPQAKLHSIRFADGDAPQK